MASLALCLMFSVAYLVSLRIEEDQRRVGWNALSAGTSPGSNVFGFQPPGAQSAQAGVATQARRDGDSAPAALPEWVQAIRATNLLSAPSAGDRVQMITQWQFLRVRDADATRLQVEVRDGAAGTIGWVDLADVGISGPPPEWVRTTRDVHLYGSAGGEDSLAVLTTGVDLMVSNQTSGQRVFVYQPQSPTSRRTGFGWISLDSIVAVAAPPGVALPSPSFHAVPLAGPGVYRVHAGDSIASICAGLGMARDDLIRLNGMTASPTLLVGQVLRVPKLSAAPVPEVAGPRQTRATSPGWVSAEYAVVIDGDSGQILWAREANTPIAPASLTKIVTALVTLDHANLSDRVNIRVDSRRMPGSTVMGIYPGEELTVEDLLYGLMLPSGNDASLALAEHVAGTRERFAELMNEKTRSLGLTGSQFINPHGLDANGHYSTAYDMAMLARDGMRNPVFRDLSAARSYATGNGKGYEVWNLNQLLWRYPGADGVKIGFTDAAGRTIVGSAVHDGRRVYVAMMRSNDIYRDSTALLDWVFDAYTWP
jgi:D-alanyl-D-alanine carboxypeptidase